MATVIHLLPYDGIGGAEAAARSMRGQAWPGLDFRLEFLFPAVRSRAQRWHTFNPVALFTCARRMLRRRPDILIVSLWRACLVGVLVKLLRRRTRLAVFIHNSRDAHWLDFVVTRLAVKMADAVWADSAASLSQRVGDLPAGKATVIPFLVQRLKPLREDPQPKPVFAFWGRMAAQKNLESALMLFAEVHRRRPDARFMLIGPDSGRRGALEALCQRLGCADAVQFAGPLSFAQIGECVGEASFYLQTSVYEGMAMSVVEAMQWGLVPVVTAVGEIARYCRDGGNAVIVDAVPHAAQRVLALLDDAAAYRNLRLEAMATWRNRPVYGQSVASACLRLLPADGAAHGDKAPPERGGSAE